MTVGVEKFNADIIDILSAFTRETTATSVHV